MGLIVALALIAAVVAVGVIGGMTWGVSHPLEPGKETKTIGGGDGSPTRVIGGRKEQKLLMGENGFSYLDAASGVTDEEILAVLEPLREDDVFGTDVACVCTGIGRAGFSRDGIVRLMEHEFGRESLTWEKFSVPVEAAFGRIRSNSARIANIVQAFDSGEYQRLSRLDKAGQVAEGSQQANRLVAMGLQLTEIHDLMYDNEAMLDELNRLQTELAKLADSHETVTADDITEEVRSLADATRQYMPDRGSGTDVLAQAGATLGGNGEAAPATDETPMTEAEADNLWR